MQQNPSRRQAGRLHRKAIAALALMTTLVMLSACEDGRPLAGTTNSTLLEHMGPRSHRDHGR